MIYARVHDKTVAEDYYAAMERLEQRLELGPPPAPSDEDSSVQALEDGEREQLLDLAGQLAEPELSVEGRLSLVECLCRVLNLRLPDEADPNPNENGRRPRAPPGYTLGASPASSSANSI